MAYGLELKDASGNVVRLTHEVSNIVEAGTSLAPTVFWSGNTYGINAKLPGLSNFDEDSVGILTNVRDWDTTGAYVVYTAGSAPNETYGLMKMLNTGLYYWTRDDATGVMSRFEYPESNVDTCFNQHGIAFWDKMGNTEFDTVRIFVGIVVYAYDHSTSTYLKLYLLGKIDRIDFAVFAKNLE